MVSVFEKVKRPQRSSDRKGLQAGEAAGKGSFKSWLGILAKNILTRSQQALDLGIFFGNKFDDQPAAEAGEKISQQRQGDVVGNRQVVNQCQRQNGIGRAASEQG